MSNTDPNSFAPDLPGRGGGANEYEKFSLTSEDAATRLISSDLWQAPGQPLTITYAYRRDGTSPDPDSTGFQQFNPVQITATETVLSAWSDVANIRFVRVDDGDSYSNDATILFGGYTAGPGSGFAILPGSRASGRAQGDVWLNTSLSYNQAPQQGNYGMETLLHEVGHVLGLNHPGDYDGDDVGTYAEDAGYAQDYQQYSVMSYFARPSALEDRPLSVSQYLPQVDDVTAVQRLYGVNATVRSGDTIYGTGGTADKAWFRLTPPQSSGYLTVWDTGGIDTFDFSGFNLDQTIDLRPGGVSMIGSITLAPFFVTVAYGTVIENAAGGLSISKIVGNDAPNVLTGAGFPACSMGRGETTR